MTLDQLPTNRRRQSFLWNTTRIIALALGMSLLAKPTLAESPKDKWAQEKTVSEKREVFIRDDWGIVLPINWKKVAYDFVFYTTPQEWIYTVQAYVNGEKRESTIKSITAIDYRTFNIVVWTFINSVVNDENRRPVREKAERVFDLLVNKFNYKEITVKVGNHTIQFSTSSEWGLTVKTWKGSLKWEVPNSPNRWIGTLEEDGSVKLTFNTHEEFYKYLDTLFLANWLSVLNEDQKEEILWLLGIRLTEAYFDYTAQWEEPANPLELRKNKRIMERIDKIQDMEYYKRFLRYYSYHIGEWGYGWDINNWDAINRLVIQLQKVGILQEALKYHNEVDLLSLVGHSGESLSQEAQFAIIDSQETYLEEVPERNYNFKKMKLSNVARAIKLWWDTATRRMLDNSLKRWNEDWTDVCISRDYNQHPILQLVEDEYKNLCKGLQ